MMQPITRVRTGARLMNAEAEDLPHCCPSCGHEDGKEGGEERTITSGKRYGRSDNTIVAVIYPYAMIYRRPGLQRHCRRAPDKDDEDGNENESGKDWDNGDGLTESGISQEGGRSDTYTDA